MQLLRHRVPTAWLTVVLTISGCGKPAPRPSDADVAAYVAQSQPSYVRVGQVRTSFESIGKLGSKDLPPGSWRIDVRFALHAGQDLYAATPAARAERAAFDRTVASVEDYRLPRIAAVEQLARQAGLMPQGASAPEPAMAMQLVTHKDQDLQDHVTLLAQPAGSGWNFFQLDAQALTDDAVGAPLDDLRRASPTTLFVTAGTDEARTYADRARRFLDVLGRAPKP